MRALILLLVLFVFTWVGCGPRQEEIHFPSSISGGWQLDGTPVQSLEEAWPDARTHGLQTLTVARYKGEGDPKVLAHGMASSAGAFETMQRWKPEPGSAAFQYGIFFIVVRSPALGQTALTHFAGELKRSFPN